MSDANGNVGPINDGQMQEAKRIKGQTSEKLEDSFGTSEVSSSYSQDDVSEETH